MRVILKQKYTSYNDGELLCLRYAKKCFLNEKVKDMFPKKKSNHNMKKEETNHSKKICQKQKDMANCQFHSCKNFSIKIIKRNKEY